MTGWLESFGKYRKYAKAIVGSWRSGDAVSQLEAIADNNSTGQWLSDFIDNAKSFYKSGAFQGLMKDFGIDSDAAQDLLEEFGLNSNAVREKVYQQLFSEYFLAMETIFYSCYPRDDMLSEPRMHLRLDGQGEPTIIKVRPEGQEVPLGYFAERFLGRIHDWLEEEYPYETAIKRAEELGKIFTSENCETLVKAMHYSLPVHYDSYIPGTSVFKLEKTREGFGFYFPSRKEE